MKLDVEDIEGEKADILTLLGSATFSGTQFERELTGTACLGDAVLTVQGGLEDALLEPSSIRMTATGMIGAQLIDLSFVGEFDEEEEEIEGYFMGGLPHSSTVFSGTFRCRDIWFE